MEKKLNKYAKGGGVKLSNNKYIFEFEQYGENRKVEVFTENGEISAKNMIKYKYGIPTNKIKLVNKLESSGYLPEGVYSDKYEQGGGVSDSDFERDYKKVKKHIQGGYGNIDSGYVETTWENLSDITYSAIEDKLIKRLSKDGLLNYAKGGDIGEFTYSIGGL